MESSEAKQHNETDRAEVKKAGPYVFALLNPSDKEFRNQINQAGYTVLEIGCGIKPRMSWNTEKDSKGSVWVGCDPGIPENGDSVSVNIGENKLSGSSTLVVYSYGVEEIPVFKPRVTICVAPNPRDIVEDDIIFNDELSDFFGSDKNQYFIISLDNRTFEAQGYRKKAKEKILDWMKENHFRRISPNHILDRFEPNSADLEEGVPAMYFKRDAIKDTI